MTVLYVFPQWFLRHILFFSLLCAKEGRLTATVNTVRTRSLSDIVFHYVATGNISKLKSLFDSGEASPFDVQWQTQESLLRVRTALVVVELSINISIACYCQITTKDVPVPIARGSKPRLADR